MKTRLLVTLGVGIALLTAPRAVHAGVANGSFESWDLAGWALHSDEGIRATATNSRPSGFARIVSSWGENFGLNPAATAPIGNRFLAVDTRSAGDFIGDNTYNTYVSQSFSLNTGETVSGWSYFFNGDNAPLDSAWVRILDADNNLVANIWSETSGPVVPALTSVAPVSGWNQWQWSASAAGNYTLQLGMTTSGANKDASAVLFDGITTGFQPVPEPTAAVLGLLGGVFLIVLRNRTR